MKESISESEGLQDLLQAEREGEELGLSSDVTDLGLKENTDKAVAFISQDAEKMKKVRQGLLDHSQSIIDELTTKPLSDPARSAVEALKQNQKELAKRPSFFKKWFGFKDSA